MEELYESTMASNLSVESAGGAVLLVVVVVLLLMLLVMGASTGAVDTQEVVRESVGTADMAVWSVACLVFVG